MIKIKIYVLKDPRTDKIRYVGKTIRELKDRLYYHRCQNGNTHKDNWVKQLNKLELIPIIELLDEVNATEDWKFWEKYWISVFRFAGFDLLNQTNGGEGTHGLIRTKEHSEKIASKLRKKVKCFDLNGNLLYIFNSVTEAAKETQTHKGHISSCTKGKINTINGFVFRNATDNFNLYDPRNKAAKVILQCKKDGTIIKKWNSIQQAAESFGVKAPNISRVLRGERKHFRNFIWKYYN